jgi:hypothetical protein
MQRKQACWNGGGLSLRRDVTNALIRKKIITMRLKGIFTIRRNSKNPRHPQT